MPKARIFTHEERLAMTKERSTLLQEIKNEKDEKNFDDENHCPVCGAELIHQGGCVECPNKCWSKCG